jgi:MFS family permease
MNQPRSYKWWVVGMLWLVCFFNYADRQAIFSVFPVLEREFGFEKWQLGLVGSAFMWVYAAGAPAAGFVADRMRRKDLILGGCLFWSFVTITTGWCSRLWQFITVRALEGFGETFYFPASMSLVSDYHGPRTRSRAMALHQSSVYAGTIAGGWLGAWFAERLGWRAGFYVFGAAGMLLALALYGWLREPPRERAAPPTEGASDRTAAVTVREALGLILRKPTAILLMLAFVCANFVATIFLTWTPTFLKEKFDFQLTTAGLSGAAFIHLGSAATVPLAGLAADRLARRWADGRIVVQLFGLLAGAGLVVIVGQTTQVAVLLTAMALFGACKGCYDSGIFASLYDVVDPRARATAAGLMNSVGWGGGALGPLFVGFGTKFGRGSDVEKMSDAIALGGAVYLVGAALLVAAGVGFVARDRVAGPRRGETL